MECMHVIFTSSPAGAVAKYCDEYVCLCVCLSVCPEDISGTTRATFYQFLCMLPMSVARSFTGMLTTGRIACRREGVDGTAQRGRSVIYDCLVRILQHALQYITCVLGSQCNGNYSFRLQRNMILYQYFTDKQYDWCTNQELDRLDSHIITNCSHPLSPLCMFLAFTCLSVPAPSVLHHHRSGSLRSPIRLSQTLDSF